MVCTRLPSVIALAVLLACGPPAATPEDERLVRAWLDLLEQDIDLQIEDTVLECRAREGGPARSFEARMDARDDLSRRREAASNEASRGVQRRVWSRFSPVFRASSRVAERASALSGECTGAAPLASEAVQRELDGLRAELDAAVGQSLRETGIER